MKRHGNVSSRGSALIMVIWVLGFLSVFTVVVNRQASQQLFMGRWIKERVILGAVSKAAVERAIVELEQDKIEIYDAFNETWGSNKDAFREIQFGAGTYSVVCDQDLGHDPEKTLRYGVCDESGRVNLNKAGQDTLKNLFMAAIEKIEEKKAISLAQAVIDWRDPDDAALEQGAESSSYRGLRNPYVPRNAPFESVEELSLVRGIDAAIYEKVKNYVTVYTGEGKVNFNTAPESVLRALGLSETLAKRVVAFRLGDDEIAGTEDDRIFEAPESITPALSLAGNFSPEDFAQISNAIAQELVSVKSDVFRIYALSRLIEGNRTSDHISTCVAARSGAILYWREGIS